MPDVTILLSALARGETQAADELLPVVYDELRQLAAARLAREPAGQTLQATALVHEAYLRLASGAPADGWEGRGHFFAAAAEAMRRILVENARRKHALKRSEGGNRVDLPIDRLVTEAADDDEILAVNDILDEFLELDPPAGQLVKLRFFVGMSMPEAAAALGVPLRTAERQWAYAKAWLYRRLHSD
jgi:RNA polymerase sigma factor (TIGR02999 family)